MKLNLIVIRTNRLESLVKFYNKLGINFNYHKHGKGPFHYSAVLENNLVFEIYPLLSFQNQVDISTRLGFNVENLDILINKLKDDNVVIDRKPKQSKWGYHAVIEDIDGRKIELLEKQI